MTEIQIAKGDYYYERVAEIALRQGRSAAARWLDAQLERDRQHREKFFQWYRINGGKGEHLHPKGEAWCAINSLSAKNDEAFYYQYRKALDEEKLNLEKDRAAIIEWCDYENLSNKFGERVAYRMICAEYDSLPSSAGDFDDGIPIRRSISKSMKR